MYGRDTRELGEKGGSVFWDYFKVVLILALLRVVMIDQGITIIHIPYVDEGFANMIHFVKNYLSEKGYY